MGRVQKKNSKGRLDRYYHLAKEKGYRARSSFKIIQINEKFGHFLEKSKVVIDLCAAPGSWCQVASNLCPLNSLIIGVDIVPIKPLPNCITFQSDITTEDCRSRLRGHMKTWKADTVLHDGAPNVGLGWVQDAFTQSHLTLQALKLAVENLTKGGTFVTKIFRSRDYNNLMWVFQQLFEKVEATKPPASRNVSAEIFVVCKGFKAPRKLDPKLLDPKQVFEEIESKATNNEAKVFDPAKRRRQRSGYEEGDNLLYHEMPLLEFLRKEEPVNTLGGLNRLTTPENTSDHEWRILRKLKLINDELLECIKDLQVLGKKDFKLILKFRKNARELLGLDEKEEEPEVQVEKLSEDQQIDKELEDLSEKQRLKERRLKKQANEKKQKEIYRNQMNMVTDMNVGIEAAQIGSESLFNLRMANKTGQMDSLAKGKKRMIFNDEQNSQDNDINMGDGEVPSSGDEADELEAQLDDMYHSYQQRRNERDANMRAKMARGDDDDQPWDGIKSEEEIEDDENYEREDESSSEDEDDQIRLLVAESKNSLGLSRDAEMFFASNSIFGELDEKSLVSDIERKRNLSQVQNAPDGSNSKQIADVSSGESDFEIVPGEEEGRSNNISDSDSESETHSAKPRTAKESADIATVEAMTLAHQVALGKMSKQDLIDEGINRNWSRDTENLPDWFVDDEKRHSKIVKPITKEAAQAILEKQKQLNARPIKKVLEAQGRKKARALKRLEKLRKKSDLINDDSGKSERDKAEEIQKLMRKLTKKQKQKPKVSVVVAAGANKRLSGRPRGVKGKYKMVDGVLKNELRALKRIAKKHKK